MLWIFLKFYRGPSILSTALRKFILEKQSYRFVYDPIEPKIPSLFNPQSKLNEAF
jgi:hypothetical protein